MGRFHRRLTNQVFNGVPPKLFWVAEKFECKDGYHTHGLLDYDESQLPTGCDVLPVLDECWQIVSAGRKNGIRYRVQFSKYDPERAAARYCAKYVLKGCADYDFLM